MSSHREGPPQPRRALDEVVAYQPGKPAEELMRERGLEHVVKLASNEGPWGPFPAAEDAIARATAGLNRYPDANFVLLREALAARHGVQPAQIAVGNGADAVINQLATAWLDPGDEVVCAWPSFPTYVLSTRKMGAGVKTVALDESGRHDLDAMAGAVGPRTRIVYVCNPNNPTGTIVSADRLRRFVEELPDHVLVVVDEAYHEYVDDEHYCDSARELFAPDGRVLVLRTFSKIFGLAGLRVGYAVAPTRVVEALDKVRGPFDVSTLAQEAAMVSLTDTDEIGRRATENARGRAALAQALHALGYHPLDAVANFLCVPLGGPAAPLYEALLDQGVIVRPLAAFGLPDAIRITVGTPAETARAIEALELCLAVSAGS